MAYKGKYDPKSLANPAKYVGDVNNIIYRSLWERNVIRWLDATPEIIEWASEELIFKYTHPVTGKQARYYPDFFVRLSNGTTKVIEVKPKHQTQKPKTPKRKTAKYLEEVVTWAVNNEKWKAAFKLADRNNFTFEIWTEDTLKEMGILHWETPKQTVLKESTKKKQKPVLKDIMVKRPRPKRKS